VPKASFDGWFRDRAAGVAIQIRDAALAQTVASRYAGVWWVGRLAGD